MVEEQGVHRTQAERETRTADLVAERAPAASPNVDERSPRPPADEAAGGAADPIADGAQPGAEPGAKDPPPGSQNGQPGALEAGDPAHRPDAEEPQPTAPETARPAEQPLEQPAELPSLDTTIRGLVPLPVAPEQSTELLSSFVALMPDAAVVVDEAGEIVAANRRAEQLFEYEEGALCGLKVEALIPERARTRHRTQREAFVESPESRPMGRGLSLAGRKRTGDEFPVDISLAPVAGAGTTLVVAAIRDVTAVHEAASVQARLATIVSSSVDAILSMTPDCRITSWNPAAERVFGYTPEEIIGKHIQVLVPAEDSEAMEELLAEAGAEDDSPEGARDTHWQRQDGSIVDVALSISPLKDASGTLIGFSCLARDVSERVRAAQELRQVLAEEERLERRHAVTSEIRLHLLSGAPTSRSLSLIAERCCELLSADMAAVLVPDDGGVAVTAGSERARGVIGRHTAIDSAFADFLDQGKPRRLPALPGTRSEGIPPEVPRGPVLSVPVQSGEVVDAVLVVVRDEGAEEFTDTDAATCETLASQTSLAFELERARADRERMVIVGDRERIARDLHDHVIQQLFAVGMYLQGALPLISSEHASERISEAIDELDQTIREIRNTIYGLLRPVNEETTLRAQLIAFVRTYEETLGFAPSLRLEGPLDSALSADVEPHVLAVVREALSNIARHAEASAAVVEVAVEDGGLRVEVVDDGVGIRQPVRSSGLANLEERASQLGGSFTVVSPEHGGTRLVWRIPL